MKARDIRHLRLCKHCGELGDNRRMLQMPDGPWHDACVVETHSTRKILQLPAAERAKITIGVAGVDLMRKLMDAKHLELAKA